MVAVVVILTVVVVFFVVVVLLFLLFLVVLASAVVVVLVSSVPGVMVIVHADKPITIQTARNSALSFLNIFLPPENKKVRQPKLPHRKMQTPIVAKQNSNE